MTNLTSTANDRSGPNQEAEALHKQMEWLHALLNNIGDAVIISDTKGFISFLNPAAQSLTGCSPEDAVGVPLETVFNIINEETGRTVENPATRALREGVAVGLANHSLLIAKDGTERPIDDSATPIRDASGEIGSVMLVFRDVTGQRKTDQVLVKSLMYANDIIATLREPFVVLDSDLRIKTANDSFYKSFHVSKEATENRLLYELGNGEWDNPLLRTLLDDVLSISRSVQDFEVEHAFPLLGHRTMLLNASPFPSNSENPELILLAIEDITQRKRADAALQDSEERYRRLFETAQDAILILDEPTGKIFDANPFIKKMLGYSHAELVGKELWQIGMFRDVGANQAAFQELQKQGYVRYENLPLKTKNGQQIEVEFVSNVYQVDHHQVIQCNIRDITERSRLERQTHEQAEALAELHLRKDEFLAMLSHELRNPLSAIFSALHILRLQPIENPIQQQAKIILERQVGQLAHLVDDLLEVSRVITGRIQFHSEHLDIRGIVQRAIESARPLIDRRKHDLSVSLPADPIWLRGDPTRLEQVFVNLLNNAAKYTDEGGHIWITPQQAGNQIVLCVRDNGNGIVPELLPRIFDLFTQADQTLDRSQGGLGIGLSIVQKLVALHGGKVEAHSAGVGQGSEFIVRLPALSPAQESAALIETEMPPAPTSRVMIVDDNVDSADMLAMTLQIFGHEVQAAYSSQAALEMAVEYQPEVVLLDIGLPDIDGYEVARRLRQQPQTKDAWLIALTGYGQDTDRQRSQTAGFDHHLVKPVDPRKLQDLLVTLAKQPRSAN